MKNLGAKITLCPNFFKNRFWALSDSFSSSMNTHHWSDDRMDTACLLDPVSVLVAMTTYYCFSSCRFFKKGVKRRGKTPISVHIFLQNFL
jgi:hypothetical protein